jgi:tripartite-type tricarboxylate transporter receptor subunit TctC
VIRPLAALAFVALGAAAAAAQPYPAHPVRVIVPFTPGGSTDILARLISQKLGDRFGQQFVVDNRPGAGGSIGAELAARATPDGYTLLMGHIGTLAVNPGLYPKLGYDPQTSFQPIALVAIVASLLVVHPSVPARDTAELLQLARAQPGGLTYGSGGNGSAGHIAMAAFMEASHTSFTHVPYRGTGPMTIDLVAGQLSLGMTSAPVVLPHVRAGALRALGATGLQRIAGAPEVPTIAESALPGFEATQWYGFVAPTGVPVEIRTLLNQAINRILGVPELVERLRDEGAYASPGTPEAFGTLIASEIARWGALIRRTNMKAD